MTSPNKSLLTTDGKILDPSGKVLTFGGQAWPLPKLAIKQLRLINAKLDRLWEVLIVGQTPMNKLSEEDWDDLAYVAFVALTRAHPDLTQEEFEEMGTDRKELVEAYMPIVLAASGKVKEAAPGEAPGPESPTTS